MFEAEGRHDTVDLEFMSDVGIAPPRQVVPVSIIETEAVSGAPTVRTTPRGATVPIAPWSIETLRLDL